MTAGARNRQSSVVVKEQPVSQTTLEAAADVSCSAVRLALVWSSECFDWGH